MVAKRSRSSRPFRPPPRGRDPATAVRRSQLAESSSPLDKRGEDVEDWTFINGLVPLNDSSGTRINKQTGKKSSPDVSLVSPEWKDKCRWSIGDQLRISDHPPIKVVFQIRVVHQAVFPKEGRWKRSGVNWENFRQEVENYVSMLNPVSTLKKRTATFVSILKKAAMKHVGKTVPGRKTFHVLTPSTKAAIKKRNELRKKVSSYREEWRPLDGKRVFKDLQ